MKRRRPTDDSLDLLLDTITNTFGSVLFLTMLVALLLRTTAKTMSSTADAPQASVGEPVSEREQARRAARVDELSIEIDILTRSLQAIPPEDPELARLQATIVTATNESSRMLREDGAMTAAIAEDQRRIAEARAEAAQLESNLEAIRKRVTIEADRREWAEREAAELARAAIELDRSAAARGIIQVNVPILENLTPGKRQIGLFLRHGRVYLMHRWGPDGERLGPNPDHFVITPRRGGDQTARARPEMGLPVDDPLFREALTAILKPFPPDDWVVGIAVHQDSFFGFQSAKHALIELGYKYEPLPTGPSHPIQDNGDGAQAQ
jgi:hypothetical protein